MLFRVLSNKEKSFVVPEEESNLPMYDIYTKGNVLEAVSLSEAYHSINTLNTNEVPIEELIGDGIKSIEFQGEDDYILTSNRGMSVHCSVHKVVSASY